MFENKYSLKHIGLQFFAEPGGDPAGGSGGDPENNDGSGGTPPEGKTYTQGQINAMMSKEKRTARQALMKELGFDPKDDKSFQENLKSIKDTLEANKSQAEKDKDAKKTAEKAKEEAEKRANAAEIKVAALSAGVLPDYLDDAITLAQSKIDEENPADKVFKDMKTKYPVFYSTSGKGGTGGGTNPPNKPGAGGESLGQRLAKGTKRTAKSSYFND